MTGAKPDELITQTEAAELRGMSLAAVNQHVRSGRWRSLFKYGKRLVYRADVVGFEPKTHKAKHLGKAKSGRGANTKQTKTKQKPKGKAGGRKL
jgi:hypothetical protein